MREILIDTNIYTHAMRGDPGVVTVLRQAAAIGIAPISIGELLSGFKAGRKEQMNRDELGLFLDSPRVRLHNIDFETAEFYAVVLDGLRKIGKPIPTNDIWIAAVAFQQGLPLFTLDRHFEKVPGLVLIR